MAFTVLLDGLMVQGCYLYEARSIDLTCIRKETSGSLIFDCTGRLNSSILLILFLFLSALLVQLCVAR